MFFGVAAMVAAVTLPQLLDVVWCSAVVAVSCKCQLWCGVMEWSCSCSCNVV